MPRAPLWRTAAVALLLAAPACTQNNPQYEVSVLDAADRPSVDALPDARDEVDGPVDATPTDIEPTDAQPADAQPIDAQPVDAQLVDAPVESPPADGAPEATMPDLPG